MRRLEHERRRVHEARTSRPSSRSSRAATGVGTRRRMVPSSTSTPNGGAAWSDGPLPALGGAEITQVLARQRRHDDPAHAHRAGPGERLRVDPRPDDKDAAGPADVDAARAQLAERVGRELEAATGRRAGGERAAQCPARRADADLRARAGRRSRRRRSVRRSSPGARRSRSASSGLAGTAASSSPSPGALAGTAPPARRRAAPAAPAGCMRVRPRAPAGIATSSTRRSRTARGADRRPSPSGPDSTSGRSPGASANLASRRASTSGLLGTSASQAVSDAAGAPASPASPSSCLEPGHRSACHAASRSRLTSRRSGSRSGTSRRSTSSPASPPVTSTVTWRARGPRSTGSLNRRSTTARSPGGRSTSSRPPGTRSSSVSPPRPRTTR